MSLYLFGLEYFVLIVRKYKSHATYRLKQSSALNTKFKSHAPFYSLFDIHFAER